ncbi:hypothetical protein WJX82_006324 [Trebouxia sp. C0006]
MAAAYNSACNCRMPLQREGRASGDASLESCLHEFFHQEHISWECPGEKQAKKQLRRSCLGTDGDAPCTPAPGVGSDEAAAGGTTRRTVSFSEADVLSREAYILLYMRTA